jgi:hypothetical protein
MWILLTAKLPTSPSPPKLSIHWSVDGSKSEIAEQQRKQAQRAKELAASQGDTLTDDMDAPVFYDVLGFGKEPNFTKARLISYNGIQIRVLPHEFTVLPADRMTAYCLGSDYEPPTHELVPNTEADRQLIDGAMRGSQRSVYDAALVDGATHEQAMMTALGRDIFANGADLFAPVGWYRCKREAALVFCDEWEIQE